VATALVDLDSELGELRASLRLLGCPEPEHEPDRPTAAELGDVLFACVNVARRLNVYPELELRAATARFRARVELAEKLAQTDGVAWTELPLAEQDAYYDRAKESA
jgi:uncharacterized protein YabN with tetrapyrrole methylase and pyrophosphatase domain